MNPVLAMRLAKGGAVILFAILIWLHGDHHGDTHRDAIWQAKWQKHVAEDATIAAKAEAAAREKEQGWAAAMDVTASALIQEKTDVQAQRDRLLADRRAGRLRLPPASLTHLPEAAASPGGGDAAAGGGIPEAARAAAFTDFLIDEAAKADQITAQLAACQAVVAADRR